MGRAGGNATARRERRRQFLFQFQWGRQSDQVPATTVIRLDRVIRQGKTDRPTYNSTPRLQQSSNKLSMAAASCLWSKTRAVIPGRLATGSSNEIMPR